jgi:hypothetical protein
MEINPNRSVNPVNPVVGPAKAQAPVAPTATDGDASFEQSSELRAALDATPDARAEVVIRAENLVASSSYPPTEIIKRIANLLAANLLTQEN